MTSATVSVDTPAEGDASESDDPEEEDVTGEEATDASLKMAMTPLLGE